MLSQWWNNPRIRAGCLLSLAILLAVLYYYHHAWPVDKLKKKGLKNKNKPADYTDTDSETDKPYKKNPESDSDSDSDRDAKNRFLQSRLESRSKRHRSADEMSDKREKKHASSDSGILSWIRSLFVQSGTNHTRERGQERNWTKHTLGRRRIKHHEEHGNSRVSRWPSETDEIDLCQVDDCGDESASVQHEGVVSYSAPRQ